MESIIQILCTASGVMVGTIIGHLLWERFEK